MRQHLLEICHYYLSPVVATPHTTEDQDQGLRGDSEGMVEKVVKLKTTKDIRQEVMGQGCMTKETDTVRATEQCRRDRLVLDRKDTDANPVHLLQCMKKGVMGDPCLHMGTRNREGRQER